MEESRESCTDQYLSFSVAGEEFGLGVLYVREIIPYEDPTRIPKVPRFLRGVINLRGRVVPVLDLGLAFDLPERALQPRSCIVIVEVGLAAGKSLWGFVADSVDQVVDLPPDQIEAPPAFGTTTSASFLRGVGKLGEKLLLILDAGRVLAAAETEGFLASAVEAPSPTLQEVQSSGSARRT